jgi:hypothetical protein
MKHIIIKYFNFYLCDKNTTVFSSLQLSYDLEDSFPKSIFLFVYEIILLEHI